MRSATDNQRFIYSMAIPIISRTYIYIYIYQYFFPEYLILYVHKSITLKKDIEKNEKQKKYIYIYILLLFRNDLKPAGCTTCRRTLSGRGDRQHRARHGGARPDHHAGRHRRDARHRRWPPLRREEARSDVLLRLPVRHRQLPRLHDVLPRLPHAHPRGRFTLGP